MAWLEQLNARERGSLLLVVLVLAGFVYWLAVWRPLGSAETRLRGQLEIEVLNLEWMQAAADEAARIRGTAAARPTIDRGSQSLLALAEQTARSAGLGGAFRRGEPAGDGRVRIWLEGAAFDRLLVWIESLDRSYAVRLEDGSVDRSGVPGLVNARLLLADR